MAIVRRLKRSTGAFHPPTAEHTDPFIHNIFDSQNLNRYSYVRNNPLSMVDPDGYGFFKKIWKALVAIVAAVVLWYALPALASAIGVGGVAEAGSVAAITAGYTTTVGSYAISSTFAVVSGGIAGAAAGAIATGSAKGALIGAVTGGAFGAIGASSLPFPGKVAASAVVGGLAAEASGGDFATGFLVAGVASFAGPFIAQNLHIHPVIAHAVAGGLASKLGGGKFADGAVTGAFAYLAGSVFEKSISKQSLHDSSGEPPDAQNEIWFQVKKLPGLYNKGNVLTGDIVVACSASPMWCQERIVDMLKINVQHGRYGIDISFRMANEGDIAALTLRRGRPEWYANGATLKLMEPRIGIPLYATQHEVGHMIGFGHRTNATNSLMSYSPDRSSVLNAAEAKAAVERYR